MSFSGILSLLDALAQKFATTNKTLRNTNKHGNSLHFLFCFCFYFVAQLEFLHISRFALWRRQRELRSTKNLQSKGKSSSFNCSNLAAKSTKSARLTWNVERWVAVETSNGFLSNCCRKENVKCRAGSFSSLITIASLPPRCTTLRTVFAPPVPSNNEMKIAQ